MVTFAVEITSQRVHFLREKMQKAEDFHFKNQDVILM